MAGLVDLVGASSCQDVGMSISNGHAVYSRCLLLVSDRLPSSAIAQPQSQLGGQHACIKRLLMHACTQDMILTKRGSLQSSLSQGLGATLHSFADVLVSINFLTRHCH